MDTQLVDGYDERKHQSDSNNDKAGGGKEVSESPESPNHKRKMEEEGFSTGEQRVAVKRIKLMGIWIEATKPDDESSSSHCENKNKNLDLNNAPVNEEPQGREAMVVSDPTKKSSDHKNKVPIQPIQSERDDDTVIHIHDGFVYEFTIRKTLEKSDVNQLSRLLVSKKIVTDHIKPFFGDEGMQRVDSEEGFRVRMYDCDKKTLHQLTFKRIKSTGCYVFNDNWMDEFVRPRELCKGDEIGLYWNPRKFHFAFTVLRHAPNQVQVPPASVPAQVQVAPAPVPAPVQVQGAPAPVPAQIQITPTPVPACH